MNWWLGVILLGTVWTAAGRPAVVSSFGRIYQGHVRLADQQLILVNASQDLRLRLTPSNLVWAFFEAPPASDFVEPATDEWQEADIGPVAIRGATRRDADVFTVRSTGSGLRGRADSFHFVYQPVPTNSEIVARLALVHQTHPSAQAGVMMRDSLAVDARCVMLGVTAGGSGFFLTRELEAGHAQTQPQPGLAVSCWVKLKREGDEFTAYQSPNGRHWSPTVRATLRMSENYYVGLATAGVRENTWNWTTFDRVQAGPSLANLAFPPRAELVSGSVVVGWPASPDGDTLEFRWRWSGVTVPVRLIARMHFQWATPDWQAAARQQSTGVWLANGEFFEGDFRAIQAGRLRISSVLYGNKSFDANNDVTMMALQRDSIQPVQFEVRTVNGSVWRAQSLAFGENEVVLQEPALGTVRVPIHELAAILRR